MSNVINWNLVKVVKIPDEIMLIEPSKKFADCIAAILFEAKFKKGAPIFFKIGQEINGQFVPYDDGGAVPEALMEAYNNLLKLGINDDYGFYACQKVKSANELRN